MVSGTLLVAASILAVTQLPGAAERRPGQAVPAPAIDFTRDVLPIFQASCIECHGPDLDESRLRLDSLEAVWQGGMSRATGLRLEVMSDASFRKGYTRAHVFFALHELEIDVHSVLGATSRVSVRSTDADKGSGDGLVDGDELTSWSVGESEKYAPTVAAVVRFTQPIAGGPGTELVVRMKHLGLAMVAGRTAIGRFRLSLTTDKTVPLEAPVGMPEIAFWDGEASATPRIEAVAVYFRTVALSLSVTRDALARVQRDKERLVYDMDRCLISVAGEPRVTRVLPRGNWMDESGDVVRPGVPASLPRLDVDGRRASRLDLANWLVSPDHPLTARVFVNRLWKLLFGAGLSSVLDDLGAQGDWPSHPDILDWLAVEFVESGWDVKHMVELMVTSAAYRQTSTETDQLREVDPYNRLISRQSRFRMQAETVRDTALSIAGILSERIGGRSVKPYQPAGYWANLNFPKRTYEADAGESQYRRGLYTHWQRSFLDVSVPGTRFSVD